MKSKCKIILIVFLIISTIFIFLNEADAININNIKNNSSKVSTTEISSVGKIILSVINSFAVVASVIIIAILGIKYMLGSASERADYQKTMIPYIVGVVLVFSGATIANAIYLLAKK